MMVVIPIEFLESIPDCKFAVEILISIVMIWTNPMPEYVFLYFYFFALSSHQTEDGRDC